MNSNEIISNANKKTHDYFGQEFIRKTIFVISTPVEAVGLSILANDKLIENCIIVLYKNYTDILNKDLILKILEKNKIKNLYFLTLRFYLNPYKKGHIVDFLKDIFINQAAIKKFDIDNFQGKLFKSNFNFVVQHFSPFLSHNRYDHKKVYTMEHSVGDACALLTEQNCVNFKKITIIDKLSTIFLSNDNKAQKLINFVFAAKKKIIYGLLIILAPGSHTLKSCKQGFSWLNYLDGFTFLDFRDYNGSIEIEKINADFLNKYKTLLLIDHKEQYVEVEWIYEELKQINYIDMYAAILKKHINQEETIICKFHPKINQKLDAIQINNYINSLREKFLSMGYKKIYFLRDIIDDLTSYMPAELFLKPLKINKVVGVYTTTLLIAQEWKDMTVISDCSYSQTLSKLREIEGKSFRKAKMMMY